MPTQKSPLGNSDKLIFNTGPVIALAKAGALEIAGALPFRKCCPPQVEAELLRGVNLGLPQELPEWLEIQPLRNPLEAVARVTLDDGEAAVIQLALEQGAKRVCIDERRGRQVATAVGLEVVGTLGLLLRAKHLKMIPAVLPYIERLIKGGDWYDRGLIRKVLVAASEFPEE